jgi:hypothetical protein
MEVVVATVLFWWGVINYPGMVLLPLVNDKTRGRALLSYISAMIGGVGMSAIALHEWFPQFQPPSWTDTWGWVVFGWLCVIIGIVVVIKKPTKKQLNAA